MRKAEDQAKRRASARQRRNAEFVRGLLRRRPDLTLDKLKADAADALAAKAPLVEAPGFDVIAAAPPGLMLETIVDKERPVLFVENDWLNVDDVWAPGVEAQDLIAATVTQKARLKPLMPLIGRIDATHFPNLEFVGSGWLIAPDIVVTNRHVASLIARWDGRKFTFRRGVAGNTITSAFDTLREFDDLDVDDARRFAVTEVLYIEPDSGPNDIAFLKVARQTDGLEPTHIRIAPADLGDDHPVLVVGYPARAPKKVIPDQELMEKLYRGRFDVKRAAPGFTMSKQQGSARHDCTTLGGNSGSVVLDLMTGEAAGLHFAGLYEEANYAVPASVLNDYVRQKRWTRPPDVETAASAPAAPAAAATPMASGSSVTVPLTITLGLGGPSVSFGGGGGQAPPPLTRRITDAECDAAVKAFWSQRPDGVIGARVGYDAEGDRFGDDPVIAASVEADQLAAVSAAGPKVFQGVPVRYFPATLQEVAEARGVLESTSTIAYDDEARTGPDFALTLVDEPMEILAHVGPEYSWDVLKEFIRTTKANTNLVSGIYEFHAPHIYDAIEARLAAGVDLTLTMDDATFHGDEDGRKARFARWAQDFTFERVVAPGGTSGLMSDAYHIKVTVRKDDTFWLSSGNWKDKSSQPIVTQAQRDNAAIEDIEGNREWHVVIKSPTLATRFRSHLKQDFVRSGDLGSGPAPEAPEAALDVEVALPEAPELELERPPPGRVLTPRAFAGPRRVTPLLTPDRKGAIYSDTVLELIRSAQNSLLFQIPYIGMPSNPTQDRGFIDALIEALTRKLKTLDDARVLLRSGGSKLSAPAHAAWYFKSKGVDIANRLRVIDNHHTKGMIVDDRRCLLGSHNWSRPGVSLNRDASLLFEDAEVAAYYKEAFEIDWERARRINPKQFVKPQQESVGAAAPTVAFRRVKLADALAELED